MYLFQRKGICSRRKTFSLYEKTSFFIIVFDSRCAARIGSGNVRFTDKRRADFFRLETWNDARAGEKRFRQKSEAENQARRNVFQNFIDKPPPAFLPNVRALYLRFFDRKLYQIEIFYEDRNEQQTAAQFVDVLSKDFNLPQQLWANKYEKYKLNCNGFSLVADKVLNPHVELTDEATRARFEEDQKSKKR